MYSCNGRPFVKQLKEQSGTWFRDLREPSNTAEPLQQFHAPAGLLDKLKRSREAAEKKLQAEGYALLCVAYPRSNIKLETGKEDEVYQRQFAKPA